MRSERGVSPIVATVLLISLTVAVSAPMAYFVTQRISPPVRERRTDVEVYAGLINENVVRLHIKHAGGTTIYDPLEAVKGFAGPVADNLIYCWTFDNPEKYRLGDFAQCEVQVHGADFRVGDPIRVYLSTSRTILYDGSTIISDIGKIPGG